MGKINI